MRRERLAVVVREVDEQRAGLLGLGADERHDGSDGVEQEVRVDLRLQGAELHARAHVLLTLELEARELRGDELGKPGGERRLPRVDVAVARVIQLDCAHAAITHDERGGDARVQTGEEARLARLGGLPRKDLHLLLLEHTQRARQHDGRGHLSESSPQLATTAVPSVTQIAEASVSGRMIWHAPSVASGVRP